MRKEQKFFRSNAHKPVIEQFLAQLINRHNNETEGFNNPRDALRIFRRSLHYYSLLCKKTGVTKYI